jgi:hypothetical protein
VRQQPKPPPHALVRVRAPRPLFELREQLSSQQRVKLCAIPLLTFLDLCVHNPLFIAHLPQQSTRCFTCAPFPQRFNTFPLSPSLRRLSSNASTPFPSLLRFDTFPPSLTLPHLSPSPSLPHLSPIPIASTPSAIALTHCAHLLCLIDAHHSQPTTCKAMVCDTRSTPKRGEVSLPSCSCFFEFILLQSLQEPLLMPLLVPLLMPLLVPLLVPRSTAVRYLYPLVLVSLCLFCCSPSRSRS